jgi:hypothetical protein
MKNTKKFLLTATALAVITSTSAFASAGIDLIKTDAITVNLDGDLDLKIINDNQNSGDNTTIQANFDDLDYTFTYKIDDSLTFIAAGDFSSEYEQGDSDGSIYNNGVYLGFSYNQHKLLIGGQEISFDTFGVDNSEVAPADKGSSYHDNSSTWHNTSAVYTYSFDKSYISATYAKADESTSTKDIYQVVAFTKTHGFELMGGIGLTTNNADTSSEYDAVYGQLEAVYNYGNGKVGVNLSMEDDEDAFTSTGVDLDFSYKLNKKATLALGASFITQDMDGTDDNDDYSSVYAGVIYKFNKYVILYTEIGQAEGDNASYGSATSYSDKSEKIGGLYLNLQY